VSAIQSGPQDVIQAPSRHDVQFVPWPPVFCA
jgi:hypothetical protein